MTYQTKAVIAASQGVVIAVAAVGISLYTTSSLPEILPDAVLLGALFFIGGAFAWASEAMAIWAANTDVKLRLVEARLWVPSVIAVLVLVFQEGPDTITGLMSASVFAFGFATVQAAFAVMRDVGD